MATPDAGAHGPRRVAGDDAGVALVEFALLLPFLAILVFGTVDLGRAYQMKNRATNMAREGAFYAQFNPGRVDNCPSGESIVDRVGQEDADLDVDVEVQRRLADGTLQPLENCSSSVPAGDQVIVTVTTQMDILTPLVGIVTGNVVDVSGHAEVVVQG